VTAIRVVDVTDVEAFALVPPCADPRFDHRTCDYWEDADRGSRAARVSWLEPASAAPAEAARPPSGNPFLDERPTRPAFNPFHPTPARRPAFDPFADDDEESPGASANPFAPRPAARPSVGSEAPRKLRLLGRGLGIFGSYAKVLLVDEEPVGYCQFGPLSAYPRAQRVRELYPRLPAAPLPAVITCIATTPRGRGTGHALSLVRTVCEDLAGRGFAAVEAYPEVGRPPDETPAATPEFWIDAGFILAVDDARYPVMRRELG
jgi:hypothetical protein